jgi:hypothetical protein
LATEGVDQDFFADRIAENIITALSSPSHRPVRQR